MSQFIANSINYLYGHWNPAGLRDSLTAKLDQVDTYLDRTLPDHRLQLILGGIGGVFQRAIGNRHAEALEWLEDYQGATGLETVKKYVYKLPLKVLYRAVSTPARLAGFAAYAAVHPLKGLSLFAKTFVESAYQLTRPETWCLLGAGAASSSIGQSFAISAPLVYPSIALATAISLAGLALTVFKAMKANPDDKWGTARRAAGALLLRMPEVILASLPIGLLIGRAQQAAFERFQKQQEEAVQAYANEFSKHNPEFGPFTTYKESPEEITLSWDRYTLFKNKSKLIPVSEGSCASAEIQLHTDGSVTGVTLHGRLPHWKMVEKIINGKTTYKRMLDETRVTNPIYFADVGTAEARMRGYVSIVAPKMYDAPFPQANFLQSAEYSSFASRFASACVGAANILMQPIPENL